MKMQKKKKTLKNIKISDKESKEIYFYKYKEIYFYKYRESILQTRHL